MNSAKRGEYLCVVTTAGSVPCTADHSVGIVAANSYMEMVKPK